MRALYRYTCLDTRSGTQPLTIANSYRPPSPAPSSLAVWCSVRVECALSDQLPRSCCKLQGHWRGACGLSAGKTSARFTVPSTLGRRLMTLRTATTMPAAMGRTLLLLAHGQPYCTINLSLSLRLRLRLSLSLSLTASLTTSLSSG